VPLPDAATRNPGADGPRFVRTVNPVYSPGYVKTHPSNPKALCPYALFLDVPVPNGSRGRLLANCNRVYLENLVADQDAEPLGRCINHHVDAAKDLEWGAWDLFDRYSSRVDLVKKRPERNPGLSLGISGRRLW